MAIFLVETGSRRCNDEQGGVEEALMVFNGISLLILASSLISLLLSLYAAKDRHNPAAFSLSLVLAAATVWSFFYGLELAATDLKSMKLLVAFQYPGIATVSVLWFIFVSRYSGNDHWLKLPNIMLLFIIPFCSVVLVATNEMHNLFYRSVQLGVMNGLRFQKLENGIFWYVHVVYSYLVVIAGLGLMVKMFVKESEENRLRIGFFIAGALLPYLVNIAYVSGFKPYGFLDLTPAGFILMGIIFTAGVFTVKLFDISPLALDLLFDSIPDAVFVLDKNGKTMNVNPKARALLKGGLCPEDFLTLQANHRSGEGQNGFLRPCERDIDIGNKVYRQTSSRILKRSGKPLGYLVTMRDITIRKRAEESLCKSEEKFRLLVENSHDIIYTLSAHGVFLFVSPAWTMLLGHPVSEVVDKPFQPFVHPDDVPACTDWLKMVIDSGRRQDGIEYRVRHLNGTWYWHTSSAVPLADDTGRTIGIYGIAKDITERKQREEDLKELVSRLQGAIEEIKTLRGIVPICAHCKKIRDDKGFWEQVETYVGKHTEAQFSHGICPECIKKLYPELTLSEKVGSKKPGKLHNPLI